MPSIAIDYGNSRVKVATYDLAAGRPILVELGREIRAVIPSIIYVPVEGPIVVGDDAQHLASHDPEGIVRRVIQDIDKPGPARRGRDINRPELATIFLRQIREDSERLLFDGKAMTACSFAAPLSFTKAQQDCLRFAAREAGFRDENVRLIASPIAAARFYLPQIEANSSAMVVCDIGAATTNFTLLDCRSGDPRPVPGLKRNLNEGAEGIDGAIWDALKQHIIDDSSTESSPTLRFQLRRIKESFSRVKRPVENLFLDNGPIAVPRMLLDKCFEAFLEWLQDELSRFVKELRNAGFKEVPLLLAGGGSQIPGLLSAISKAGWLGAIHLRKDAEFATVLGTSLEAHVQESAARSGSQKLLPQKEIRYNVPDNPFDMT
jgi:molecular chaperone DnaK (HSP70)